MSRFCRCMRICLGWTFRKGQAAKLLWTCWRHREIQVRHRGQHKGIRLPTDKRPLRHLARFILIELYTGTRAAAIASTSPVAQQGRSFVDLERGIYYRLAQGTPATNKRQTLVPLPSRLLAHLRRDMGIAKQHFVEFNGRPVKSVKIAFKTAVSLSGLEGKISPHTLHHAAATWLMQIGVSTWEAAGFLGMSEKTLRDVYGHHHPDYLHKAASAIGTMKPISLVNSLVRQQQRRLQPSQPIEKVGGPGRCATAEQFQQLRLSNGAMRDHRR